MTNELATAFPRRSDAGIVPMPPRRTGSGCVRLLVKHDSFALRAMAMLGRTLHAVVQRSAAGAPRSRRLQLLETLSVGERKQILLVECDGVRFLVTSSAQGLSAPAPVYAAAFTHEENRIVAGSRGQ